MCRRTASRDGGQTQFHAAFHRSSCKGCPGQPKDRRKLQDSFRVLHGAMSRSAAIAPSQKSSACRLRAEWIPRPQEEWERRDRSLRECLSVRVLAPSHSKAPHRTEWHSYFPDANDIATSALSASSTFSMVRGVSRINAATKVSGTCWMRILNVLTESL